MAMLNEEIQADSPVVEESRAVEAETPSIHGSGDAMWSLDQSEVDVMPESYTVKKEDGTSYTQTASVGKVGQHYKHRDVKNAKDTYLSRDYGGSETYKKAEMFKPGAPVTMSAGQKPTSLSALGEVGKGSSYKKAKGTLASPKTDFGFYPDSLFIKGTTYPEDIQQCDMGDCYFLAALLSIIHADPSFIPRIMSVHDGVVRTNLYHKEGEGDSAHWVRKPIETKYGSMGVTGMHGSYHRVAFDPKESVWSADVEANTLSVTRKDLYEAALWVNCLEHAYTYYARLYGQYGDSSQAAEEVEKRDGDHIVGNGGFAGKCLHMFFGEDVPESDVHGSSAHSREAGIWESSKPLIAELMKLAMTQDGSKKEDTFICVAAHKGDIGPRGQVYAQALSAEIEAELEGMEDAAKKADLEMAIEVLKDVEFLVGKYLGQPVIGNREGIKSDSEAQICNSLHEAQMKLASNETLMAMNNGNYIALRSVLGTIVESKSSDIFILQRHAYNVARIDFKDKNGQPVVVDNSTSLDELEGLVDLDKSTVILENPHGETKAVRPGETRTREDEGAFEASLRETLASITQFTSVVGQNHRHDGDENAQSIAGSVAVDVTSKHSSSAYNVSYKYEYWDFDGNAKGDVLNENEVAERGNRTHTHIEDTEDYLNESSMFLKLDSKGNQTDFQKGEASKARREAAPGAKYTVTPGVRSAGLPSPKELYQEDASGVEIKYFQGTIKEPNVSNDIVPKGLFIDGEPSARDVLQGGIGDCYFLASVLHVLNTQPQRIKDMITIQGNDVDVAFYHREPNGSWQPTHVRTKWGYTAAVQDNLLRTVGARVRVADKPSGAPMWQAKINGQALCVNKKSMYEAAMWVNLMENAYSLFAEKYGKYGRGTSENGDGIDNGQLGRVGTINFGQSQCLQLFFGSSANNHSSIGVTVGKDGNITNKNEPVFQALLNFAHPGKKSTSTEGMYLVDQSMICASISTGVLLDRLKMLAKNIQKEAKSSSQPEVAAAKGILEDMVKYITKTKALGKAGDSGSGNAEVIAALQTLNEYSVRLAPYNDALMSLSSWHNFRNATASLVNMSQNRFILAEHAYNVKSVEFFDKDGKPFDTTDVKEFIAKADLQKSRITMQNPHGTNTPNYDPTNGDQQGSTGKFGGEFTISLEEYINSIGTMAVSKFSYYTISK